MNQSKKVLIVGLGLLGGSYAMALGQKGYEIYGIDQNPDTIAYALEHNIISQGSCSVDKALLAEADIVIFGLYPQLIVDWVAEHQVYCKTAAILTDVCGVKKDLVVALEDILREDLYYVGAHPMAGKEVSGIAHADPHMFRKANFILTPTEHTAPHALAVVRQLAVDMEFLRISELSPEKHDKAIGFLSQLTHVSAVSLMNCQNNEDYIKYTGDSFRDLTRIACINEHLWSELFLANQETLLEEIDLFAGELAVFRQVLAEGDVEAMKEKFITSTQRRKKFQ